MERPNVDPSAQRTNVTLRPDLVDRIERRLPHSPFDSVDEYASYVLEDVLARVEAETDEEPSDQISRDEVEARLKSLGYLE